MRKVHYQEINQTEYFGDKDMHNNLFHEINQTSTGQVGDKYRRQNMGQCSENVVETFERMSDDES